MDAGNMIKPLLARGELRMIGATTLDEFRKHVEKDPALERRFQQVYVGEPSVEDTIGILRGLKERYEVHHGVRIQDSALVSAAMLSNRYLTNRFLPDTKLVVTNATSKAKHEVRTDRTGHFEFLGLPPGQYGLEVSIPGSSDTRQARRVVNVYLTIWRAIHPGVRAFMVESDGRLSSAA